uniref:Uncharacterized protein n=1 Tax=Populus trichocarpa TaxID=3694 RepID=A0A2K2BBY3_POPTR
MPCPRKGHPLPPSHRSDSNNKKNIIYCNVVKALLDCRQDANNKESIILITFRILLIWLINPMNFKVQCLM